MEAGQSTTATELTVSTQYFPSERSGLYGLDVKRMADVGMVVDHPAGATVAYTVQVSNMTDEQIQRGGTRWADYLVIGSKSAVECFYIDLDDPPFVRVRLKAVTAVAAGTTTVDFCSKA